MDDFFESIKIRKMVLIYFIVSLIIMVMSEVPYFKENTVLDFTFWHMVINFILFLWCGFKIAKGKLVLKDIIEDFKVKGKWKEIINLVIINITLSTGFLFCICFLVYKINPQMLSNLLNEASIDDSSTISALIFDTIGASLLAPVVEEFIFRGIILNRLKMRWGIGVSIIISSILFGLMHADLAFLGGFVFGIIMSIVYIRTKNILITMSIHFLNNLIASFVSIISFFMDNSSTNESIAENEIYIMGIVGLIIFVISGFFALRYIMKNWPKEKSIDYTI